MAWIRGAGLVVALAVIPVAIRIAVEVGIGSLGVRSLYIVQDYLDWGCVL